MIPYDSILQSVEGKIYRLQHQSSDFHLHKSHQDSVEIYGVGRAERHLFVAFTNGDRFIYSDVPEDILKYLDTGEDIYPVLADLKSGKYPQTSTEAQVAEVAIKDVLDTFCRMQDYITTTTGLWVTDRADLFQGQRDSDAFFQLKFDHQT